MTNQTCWPRAALKEYLSGWSDEQSATAIEEHLSQCSECEQTLSEIETDPDTLLEQLRSPIAPEASDGVTGSVIQSAIQQAQQWMAAENIPPRPFGRASVLSFAEIGGYKLLRLIGCGGMAAVYLAKHKQLGKQVAVKILPATSAIGSESHARFMREIQAVGRVNHPSIITATDAGEFEGTHFLVMEFVDGKDLGRIVKHTGPLSIRDACEIIRQAALGLSHAHSAGIVHRDIKPSNVMLDRMGAVKILDFGLAQLDRWDETSADLTTVGQLMGTLDYMAPEQADHSGAVDYRADLYSLGATLFQLLCGRAPLASAPKQSPFEKLRLLSNRLPPRLDTLRPDATKGLVKLVADMLARNPEDRPTSAAHIAEDLEEFAAGHNLAKLATQSRELPDCEPVPSANALFDRFTLATQLNSESRKAGNGNRKWKWISAAAFAPLIILFGILIVETQKGQLIIESDGANVQVKLATTDNRVTDLQIKPGLNSMRLFADQYELTVAPAEGITIDKDVISITSGGLIVVRITQKNDSQKTEGMGTFKPELANTNSMETKAASNNVALPENNVYDGKTLSEWLQVLGRDRSPTATSQAFAAIDTLITPQTSKTITDSILAIARQRDGTQRLPRGSSAIRFDPRAFETLAKANPGEKYVLTLLSQLQLGDDAWTYRVLTNGLFRHDSASVQKEIYDSGSRKILLKGLDEFLNDSQRQVPEETQQQVLIFLHNLVVIDSSIFKDDRLTANEVLLHFHRSHVGIAMYPVINPGFSDTYRSEVVARAVNMLNDLNATPEQVCLAAIQLKADTDHKFVQNGDLKRIVIGRLDLLRHNSSRLLSMVQIPQSESSYFAQYRSLPVSSRFVVSYSNDSGEHLEFSEVIEVLELAKRIKDDQDVITALANLAELTQERHAKADAIIKREMQRNGGSLPFAGVGRGRRGGATSGGFRGGKLYVSWPDIVFRSEEKQADEMTEQDAIAYFVHETIFSLLPNDSVKEKQSVNVYYTGGDLPGGEWPIPSDRQLGLRQALETAGYRPLNSVNFGPNGSLLTDDKIVILRQPSRRDESVLRGTIEVNIANVLNGSENEPTIENGDTIILNRAK